MELLYQWPYQLYSYSPQEVQLYCVQDHMWQQFRIRLKGLPTAEKLAKLEVWLEGGSTRSRTHTRRLVQVSNYINALKRGGQLGMDLKVKR